MATRAMFKLLVIKWGDPPRTPPAIVSLCASRSSASPRSPDVVAPAVLAREGVVELLGAAGTDDRRGHDRIFEHPRDGHLRHREGDAARGGAIEDGDRRRLIALQAEGHGAQTQLRDAKPGTAETNVTQACLPAGMDVSDTRSRTILHPKERARERHRRARSVACHRDARD